MSEYKMGIGKSDEWYTPKFIFDELGVQFDLDPCSSGKDFVPAKRIYTRDHDGMRSVWRGDEFVFMNPPFGGRNAVVPWLHKFYHHGNGIGLCRAYTSSGWFHDWMPRMDCLLFPRGKTKFIDKNGKEGKSPSSGIVLFGKGEKAVHALKSAKLGMFFMTTTPTQGGKQDGA